MAGVVALLVANAALASMPEQRLLLRGGYSNITFFAGENLAVYL